MDDNFLPNFLFGSDYDSVRLHEENKLLKQQIERLQNRLKNLTVTFEQETGREVSIKD